VDDDDRRTYDRRVSDVEIQPPLRQSLAQAVARQLLELIQRDAFPVGSRLPTETELKERFQVGRSTIREALNGLVLLGVVEVKHGHGAIVVRRPESNDGLTNALRESLGSDLLEARRAVELAIAECAAERAEEEDLMALRALVDEAERKVADGGAAVEEAVEFHRVLAEASGNPIFIEFIQMILGLLEERGETLKPEPGYAAWEVEMHRRLYDAVASGDAAQARAEMERHLGDMQEILRDGWDAYSRHHGVSPGD
jgi:GntR family transcriptional regulator, transcriptional repressor for pyruvate dehydrogenase complex